MYDEEMLADLAEAIERLDIPVDGAALAEAIALRDRLDAKIVAAASEFDAAQLWDIDGATSMTAWLRSNAKMTSRAARRMTSMAARLRQLPVCSRAYADGSLTGGQVEAIVACLDEATVDVFADYEAELVPYLTPLTVAGVSRAMAAWKSRVENDGPDPKEPERSLHLSQTLDDRWVLDGTLDAEGGSVVATALRLAATDDRTHVFHVPAVGSARTTASMALPPSSPQATMTELMARAATPIAVIRHRRGRVAFPCFPITLPIPPWCERPSLACDA